MALAFAALLTQGQNTNKFEIIRPAKYGALPDYLRFNKESKVGPETFNEWALQSFKLPEGNAFKLLSKENDNLGFTHYRLQQTVNGYPVTNTMYILHTHNGVVETANGATVGNVKFSTSTPIVKEEDALATALKFTNATLYKWQVPSAEKNLKEGKNNANATYYPKGELVYVSPGGKLNAKQFQLAYRFDIYAAKPLSRKYVFVDAITGKVIYSINRIQTSNVTATVNTQYSGQRSIITDSYNGVYRLRETTRGGGIETLNLQQSTDTSTAIDFTDATNTWATVNIALDQYANDIHFGTEATFDFYKNSFNRNSLDNNNWPMIAYAHCDYQMENAYWDGDATNYGDGNGMTSGPFTSLEVIGHENTHGVTQFTAGLIYDMESGALNESFSDCMGAAVRQSVLQAAHTDWLIGDQLGTSYLIRSMSDPELMQQPSTYNGPNWSAFADVHTNSGPQNFWFYLLSEGGTGVNENGQAYNVPAIGLSKATAIAYRNLTVYLTPNSQYYDSRDGSIQAAVDLYGDCSAEVKAVMNAWYAVGVGDSFSMVTRADFNVSQGSACYVPSDVQFTSTGSGGTSYVWNFGDGTTGTGGNITHTYTTAGVYDITLTANGVCGGRDSIVKLQYVTVGITAPTVSGASICSGQSATLHATAGNSNVNWYTGDTSMVLLYSGNNYNTGALHATTDYYAQTYIPGVQTACGPADHSFGTGANTSAVSYPTGLIFNSYTNQILKSVDVYAQTAGTRTFYLFDSYGDTLTSASFNLTTGLNTVPLNFNLPTDYYLMLATSGTVNLYENTYGSNFPYYNSSYTMSIEYNSDYSYDNYYFFYNWIVGDYPCTSALVLVPVSVMGPTGSFTYQANGNNIAFNADQSGLLSYSWNFGDGSHSSIQNPSHQYTHAGNYLVTLIQTDASCTDTVTKTISIVNGINQLNNQLAEISVSPNPVNNILHAEISANGLTTEKFTITVANILGETLNTSEVQLENGVNKLDMDVSAYASGVYLLTLQSGTATSTKRFVKSR